MSVQSVQPPRRERGFRASESQGEGTGHRDRANGLGLSSEIELPVMGVQAHQDGFLPIHASAVEADGRAVLFRGDSGPGKSTVAAAFQRRGHALVADDLCAVSLDRAGCLVDHLLDVLEGERG